MNVSEIGYLRPGIFRQIPHSSQIFNRKPLLLDLVAGDEVDIHVPHIPADSLDDALRAKKHICMEHLEIRHLGGPIFQRPQYVSFGWNVPDPV